MKEGSTEAPIRHPLDWHSEEFYDAEAIDAELRRVFDICHGCRRCFNLCETFPRLFDLIDESESGELDTVDSADFKPAIDACTLCDMCFMTKCPYVPPHEFNLDFPHLMLRYRAAERKAGKSDFVPAQLAQMDRNGKLAAPVAGLVNWGARKDNKLTRPVMAAVAGIDADVELPKFHSKTFSRAAREAPPAINSQAPAHGRKAVIYATCFVNYNNPGVGMAALQVLAKNGVAVETDYPACCGMPYLEQGNLEQVAEQARKVSAKLCAWIDQGYDVLTLTASCGLMLKFEWPLILPDDENIKKLSQATFDIDEYVVDIAKKEGLADGLKPLDGNATLHLACHSRAQNMGAKGAELLRLIPDMQPEVIERCSGHGGTFGVMKETHPLAVKVGKPVVKKAQQANNKFIVSECPLAAKHILQGMRETEGDGELPTQSNHPIELLARSYGLAD